MPAADRQIAGTTPRNGRPAPGVTRRLSAILVADLAGYTEHMRENEASAHKLVRSDFKTILLPKIRSGHGRVVKTMGDGLLAEFASVVDCVECAIAIQEAVAAKNETLTSGTRFQYRIAVNLGDIIIDGDDIYGDGVNVATRLQAIGSPGSVVVSGDAYRHVKGKLNVEFEDLGDQMVKGVAEPVRVHRVVSARNEPARSIEGPGPSRSSLPTLTSIAVLPFDNLSGDPERSYFSDGITNDIITDLSKFSQLLVLASHSVFAYKNRAGNIPQVSRELGVRYIVEGSIQSADDRVRINVQLVEGQTGRHLWAERYDRPMREIFRLQDEIVSTVVGALVARVHHSEHQRILRSKPDSLEAYDVYLRGRAAYASWTSDSNRVAEQYFRQAVELDPSFALAYGYLASTLLQARLGGWDRGDTLDEAAAYAQKSVDLGPSEFDNHWSLASIRLFNREFEKALSAFERAGELNPNSPNLFVDLAEALVYVDRPHDAIANVRRAMQLNPIHPDWYYWTLGFAHYHAGEYEQSLTALKRGNPPALSQRILIAAYVRLGRLDDAKRAAALFLKSEPDYSLARERVWPYQNREQHESLIADLREAGLPEEGSAAEGGREGTT